MKKQSVFFKRVFRLSLKTVRIFLTITFLMTVMAVPVALADPGDILWSYSTGEAIWSSPVIGIDGVIYVGSNDGYLYAMYPDGTLKWRYMAGSEVYSPVIGADGTIYVGTINQLIYAVNPDGTLKWKYETGDQTESSPHIGNPAIRADGVIYIGGGDDHLYAINPDGTLKWRYKTEYGVSGPVIGSDGTIYTGSSSKHENGSLYAINPDGTLKWQYEMAGQVRRPVIGPDGIIYAFCYNYGDYAKYLNLINPDGTLKSQLQFGSDVVSCAVDIDGTIYMGREDQYFYALNPDGSEKWKFKTNYYVYTSPIISSGGVIYFGSIGGYMYAVFPDSVLYWESPVGSIWISSPAMGSDGTIYIGTNSGDFHALEGGVFECVEGESGKIEANVTSGEFGDAFLNYPPPTGRYMIRNTGIGCNGLSIQSVTIAGKNRSEFIIADNSCPANLKPFRRCSFDVSFSPVSPGPKTASLIISSDDPDTPVMNIPLAGNAEDTDSIKCVCTSPATGESLTPTIMSVKDGYWNDPTTWNLNRIPGENDIVLTCRHKIISGPVTVNTLCNYGRLTSLPDTSLEIRAPGGISNYVTGIIRGQDGTDGSASGDCGDAGKDVILKTGINMKKFNKAGDWWWESVNAGPIYNNGQITGGHGSDGACGGKGGDVLLLGRNVLNDFHGVVKAGNGGNGTDGSGGSGGLTQIFGKLGGPGDLISRGTVVAGNGGNGAAGGRGGNLWFVSLPNVFLGVEREKYMSKNIQSTHQAGSGGNPDGKNGWIRIEPNVISIGAGVELKGGDITIFGGNDWVLDFSEAQDTVIESEGNITLAAGTNGVIDLRGNTETILKAGGNLSIFADDIRVDKDVMLSDITESAKLETGSGKILRDFMLTGAGQIAGPGGEVVPVRISLANGGSEPDTYILSAADSGGQAIGSPIEVDLEGLDSADFDLDVTIPPSFGETEIITITAASLSDPETVAQAEVRVSVQPDAYIRENSPAGTSAGKVGTGLAGAVTYDITEGNTDNTFAVNSSTGEITLTDTGKPDFETSAIYKLKVQVSDGTNTETTPFTVRIDNINESPVVSDMTFSVDENSPVLARIAAQDEDNDTLTYAIKAGNDGNVFAVSRSTGEITVNDTGSLDYETGSEYALTVQASDGENISEATVAISVSNLNDNTPVIKDQALYVGKNSGNGEMIGIPVTDDADNDFLTYTITSGNENNAFAVNANTGEITVNNAALIDYDTPSEYRLTLRVSDGRYSDTGAVTIGVNSIPSVSPQTLFVDENSANGSPVGQTQAFDADSDVLAYSIISGNSDNIFAVSADTGQVTVNDGSGLDYETTAAYAFTVRVSDGKHSVTAPVTVKVNNMNDNLPEIHDRAFTIDENTPAGTVVGRIEASDADGYVQTYRIRGGNENNAFAIQVSDGEITVNNMYQLDYEKLQKYVLTVRVFDGDNTDTAEVTVNLRNLNDNAPVVHDQVFFIDENIPNSKVFGMAGAGDADSDPLSYSIISGNSDNIFAVGTGTGYLSVNDSSRFDPETVASYPLTVQVSDGVHTDTAVVTVNLFKTGNIAGDTDGNGIVDLGDAVIILKVLTGIAEDTVSADGDVNGDAKIGLEDVIYILQKISHYQQ